MTTSMVYQAISPVDKSLEAKPYWNKCNYCKQFDFKIEEDFIRHLRKKHCRKECDSYVCQYGCNGVCTSLPVEAVSDKDYKDHILKHHAYPLETTMATLNGRKARFRDNVHPSMPMEQRPAMQTVQRTIPADDRWTVYSGSQNLPAVLNDPNAGKQRDFFTKLWGDSFVEKTDIPKPHHLPEITAMHFESYLRKTSRRYHKHSLLKENALKQNSQANILQRFPKHKNNRYLDNIDLSDLSSIPYIFTEPTINLSRPETFNQVYSSHSFSLATIPARGHRDKTHLDKLTTYLDLVEIHIAHQVAHKSEAFFHAMTSHDALMDQLARTITVVKALRENIQRIDKTVVRDSLNILRLTRVRCNHLLVHQKLKLMATVHQTQPMIQLLLSTPDYVAALDLISTTQEILAQELAGVHSFRHLGSQLLEMERMIDKMLNTEFQRYSTADLNRPLTENHEVLEGDKLVSIILGMLRQKHFHFIDTYKDEAFTTMKAIVKQIVIELIAASDSGDSELVLTGLGDQLQSLALHDWILLLENTTHTLLQLIHRVKAARDVMLHAANISAGKVVVAGETHDDLSSVSIDVSDPSDSFLSNEEHARVVAKLRDLMTAVCDYAHERVAQLVTTQSQSVPIVQQGQLPTQTWSESSYWLVDKATAAQVCDLARVMDVFTNSCEEICGRVSSALRSAFKVQASKFVHRFHHERKTKLGLILDSERWKQADVPPEFQHLVDHIVESGKFAILKPEPKQADKKVANILRVKDEDYTVVGTALLLLKMVVEYCVCASDLSVMAPNVCRNLAELLQLFNSRSCQLVLGAGALHVAGLKTITSTNLVLASRALQLVLWMLPYIRDHFQALLSESSQLQPYRHSVGVNVLDSVTKDIDSHVKEIEMKVVSIVNNLITVQLQQWEAKPPVPSLPFRNISKHLTKLHEAVSSILPPAQVHTLYRTSNNTFKEKLREQLVKMNVVNNGGPQHGVVTSELTFYLKTLRTLGALPLNELSDSLMDDIWLPR